ncbi:MAG: M48 family metallopeptidase [Gemmatimonadaceae bacterium]|nr:M48 family metallopeptidase [Gemmatimonadaceae bacterium]
MTAEPQDLFSQQEANRGRSRLLVVTFVVFFLWLGLGGDWLAYMYTRGLPPGAYHHSFPVLGALMAVIAAGLVAYIRKTGASKVLWSTGAVEVTDPQTPGEKMLANVVDEMSIAAGVPRPRLWVVNDPDPNAFATGTDPLHSHIAVTTGLLNIVTRDELQAVVGHEMGHVKNLDTQMMTMVAGLVGAVALMSDGVGRILRFQMLGGQSGGGGRVSGGSSGSGRGRSNNLGPLVAVVLVLWIVSWIMAPIVTRLMAVGISRNREYLADAMSAQFTRNPLALASALEKIEDQSAPTTTIKGGAAHLCIADPLGRAVNLKEGFVANLLATHPPMPLRIARLKAMGYQQQKAAGTFHVQD